MRFAILGSLEVSGDGGDISVRGKRRRAILIRLLIAANTPVDTGVLCEDVWGGAPPDGAASTLQSHLSLLRQLLDLGRIRGSGGSVILRLGDDELDAQCFERELQQGSEALRAGAPARAADLLDRALERWRGAALADVAGEGWALPELARLEELKTLAFETRLDARLELGEHQEVIAPAEHLLVEHPFREHVAAQLMLALYRSGRQADALRVYQRVRSHLGEELGIEPSTELTALEEAIILHKANLDLPERPSPRNVDRPSRSTGRETPIPLPPRLIARPAVGVVGRQGELEAIADSVRRVTKGDAREVVLVSGEAGVGKTTLVAEAARTAFADGACVLFGRCDEDVTTPYQLFTETLGHFVAHASTDQLVTHVGEYGFALTRIVPGLASRAGGLPPAKPADDDSERYLLFAAVVGLLTTISARQPLVLVVDDLQWADKGSLQVLRHLIAAEAPMRVLLVGTYRDSALSHSHPLLETLAALHRVNGVARIELSGLDETGVMSFVEAAAGHVLDDAGVGLAQALYRETDGNPFFVSEILRHLSETGAIYEDATGWWVADNSEAQLGLPESLRVVIGARVGRLGVDTGRVLSVAAVIGRDFDLDLLEGATGISPDDLLDVLDRAEGAALVRELADAPGRYSFAHALIQHTLYEDLGPTRRARAHRQVAEALEDLCGDRPGHRLGEFARHWCAATQPRDLTKALEYSHRAADAALAALAPGDALRYYSQALDLCSDSGSADAVLPIDLAIGLGTAQRQVGDPAFRETLLDAAHRAADLGDTGRLVAAALANDRGSGIGTIDAEKIEVLEMALASLPAGHLDRALLLATLSQELIFGSPFERCQALADEALAIAEASGDDAVIVRVLNRGSFLAPPLLEHSMERTAEAMARAERLADPVQLYWAVARRHTAAVCAGDMEEADRCLGIAGELVQRLAQPSLSWGYTGDLATRALIAGDADRAELLATEALRIATESGQPNAELWFGGQIMTVCWQRGTLAELVPMIDQLVSDYPGFPVFVAVLAQAHAEAGMYDDARRLLRAFAATDFDLPLDGLWLTGMMSYAEAVIECRAAEYAGPLMERLAPWSDRVSIMEGTTAGPVSHAVGGLAAVLGRYDEAEHAFSQACDFSVRVGAKFFAARTELLWGRMQLERVAPGDVEAAGRHLATALDLAVTHGYGNVERRAREGLELLSDLHKELPK